MAGQSAADSDKTGDSSFRAQWNSRIVVKIKTNCMLSLAAAEAAAAGLQSSKGKKSYFVVRSSLSTFKFLVVICIVRKNDKNKKDHKKTRRFSRRVCGAYL